jgi:hypothetical protein
MVYSGRSQLSIEPLPFKGTHRNGDHKRNLYALCEPGVTINIEKGIYKKYQAGASLEFAHP